MFWRVAEEIDGFINREGCVTCGNCEMTEITFLNHLSRVLICRSLNGNERLLTQRAIFAFTSLRKVVNQPLYILFLFFLFCFKPWSSTLSTFNFFVSFRNQ